MPFSFLWNGNLLFPIVFLVSLANIAYTLISRVCFVSSGADIIGINCHFGPDESIEACRLMKEALDAAGIKKHLMVQPLGYLTPDAGKQGFIDLPEFPFGKLLFSFFSFFLYIMLVMRGDT